MEIRNKTNRPLRIPLPAGKRLHLGPAKTAKIVPKSLEHPPVKALLDSGEIEVVVGGRNQSATSSSNGSGAGGSQASPSSGGVRHTGDR